MLKFRPSNLTQKRANISFSELQLVALIEKGLSDNSLRGFLYKRSSPNAKWRMKWFLLFENLLFYFDISPQEQQAQLHQQSPQQSQSDSLGASNQSPAVQQQQQQQQQLQLPSKSSGFTSFIRRGQSSKRATKSRQQQIQQEHQQREFWPETAEQLRLQLTCEPNGEPRRASAGETLNCGPKSGQQQNQSLSWQPSHQLHYSNQQHQQQQRPISGDGPRSRQRLQSDPQNLRCGVNSFGADSLSLGSERASSANFSSSQHGNTTSQHRVATGCLSTGASSTTNVISAASTAPTTTSRGSSRTLNSSSISGVSSHFLAHNEQTIGRSTTTTAGKTPSIHVASSNYSSLLNRKIGVIFLEGSYCERLVDSPVDFETTNDSMSASSRLLVGSSLVGPNAAAATMHTNMGGSVPGTARGSLKMLDGNDPLQQQASRNNSLFQQTEQQFAHVYNSDKLLTTRVGDEESELYCTFTLKWRKEGSKEYQFRTETEAECQTWVHAIANARYSTLLNDKEQLEQKYLHLSQIIESESTAKWQYSRQCEELSAEIKKLRQEICLLKRQESRSNQLRMVLSKSAAIVETIVRQQHRRQQQQQQKERALKRSTPVGSSCVLSSVPVPMGVAPNFANRQQHVSSSRPSPVEGPASCGPTIQNSSAQHLRLNSPVPAWSTSDNDIGGGSRDAINTLQRTRSVEQGQAEHERAVRRSRRYNVANYIRLTSLDEGGGSGANERLSSSTLPGVAALSALAKSLVRTASGTTSPIELRRPKRKLIRLSGGADCGSSGHDSSTGGGGASSPLNKLPGGSTKQQAARNLSDTNKLLVGATNELNDMRENRPADNLNDNTTNGRNTLKGEAAADNSDECSLLGDDDENQFVNGIQEEQLSVELMSMVEAINSGMSLSDYLFEMDNSEEIRKIKKVQGFFRGWLCRRRWKQIVQEYIKSPHAESMRKRNNLVFRMVECEEEYVEQLNLLISAFLRPIKMAASSQRPPLSHDELNSIFLNSETLLFLHQIFLKGLTARMESWPTLVLGDLFNMLLPMLTIYQEYVRNHHFSLQVLAECKQRDQFSSILHRLEEKPQLNGRTLETFLTYPMHQIPRYIICLHEILAHTPHNHVERRSLYEAQTKLEELSQQMHDEVSETENIRQNLAIERMIIGGCDILLDVNQVFVRQGVLLQVIEIPNKHSRSTRSRFTSFSVRPSQKQQQHHGMASSGVYPLADCQHNQVSRVASGSSSSVAGSPACHRKHHHHHSHHNQNHHNPETQTKELVRQCFLFTNHLILCTRTKDGKLHLLENIGRISLAEVTLIENPAEFIQQQETIIANFELIPRQPNQQNAARPGQPASGKSSCSPAAVKTKNSSCNSISDYHSASADVAPNVQYDDKRASTSSVPNKWGSSVGLAAAHSPPLVPFATGKQNSSCSSKQTTGGKRTSFVDIVQDAANNELDHNDNVDSNNHGTSSTVDGGGRGGATMMEANSRATSVTPTRKGHLAAGSEPLFSNVVSATSTSGATTSSTMTPAKDPLGQSQTIALVEEPQHQQQLSPQKSSSRSSRITGYLATKLSNLTNLGSSSAATNNNRDGASSSAPPSPMNKRHLSQMFSATGGNSNPSSTTNSKRNSRASSGALYPGCCCCSNGCDSAICLHQPPFSLTKDYGGCNFILLLESTSKITSGNPIAVSSGATVSASGIGGPGGSCGGVGTCVSVAGGLNGISGGAGGSGGGGHKENLAAGASGNSNSGVTCSSLVGSGGGASGGQSGLLIIHLVAPNLQEKAAWMSDISQ